MYMLYSAHQVQDLPQHLLANNYYHSQTTIAYYQPVSVKMVWVQLSPFLNIRSTANLPSSKAGLGYKKKRMKWST